MVNIWVIAEIRENKIKKVTLEALGKASELVSKAGGEVAAVALGHNISSLVNELGNYGAKKVYLADSPQLAAYSTEGYASVIENLIRQHSPDIVFAGATNFGKDLMPRVAAKLETGLATDCTDAQLDGEKLIVTRPIYAGKAITKVAFSTKPQMATLRPNVFTPINPVQTIPEVVNVTVPELDIHAKVVELVKTVGQTIELTEANIIVSGGRGMKNGENFKILEELASVLGAAVGASRAAVDAGWKPQSFQVGQTGKVVSPQLYIACGISGAIQHLAGMGTSKCIVAINKDPNAPIFKVADYGIVGDLFQIVPMLTKEFRKLKGL